LIGSTVDRIPITKFPDFPITIPALQTQRQIAAILSAYDDLIENNLRRIEILEEMAQNLYREWFLKLRFPGHQHARFIDSPLDPIPREWSVKRLDEDCERITDGAHHSPKSTDVGMPMASVKDMSDWGLDLENARRISEADYRQLIKQGCQPMPGDILVAKDGANLNKHTILITEKVHAELLSSIAIIRTAGAIDDELLLAQIKYPEVSLRIKRSASGAAIPRIVLKDFKQLEILVPPKEIQAQWRQLGAPIAAMCRSLVRKNRILRSERDLLLPKLISGELDVSELDIAVPEDAA
jgi:type I restriction enzyme, S subunit